MVDTKNKMVGDEDERAVSPVIGVILMVAITVILAAVIAAFVMDIGDMGNSPPNANFEWEQTGEQGEDDLTVTATHTGGESIDGGTLIIKTGSDHADASWNLDSSDWSDDISAGNSFTVTAVDDHDDADPDSGDSYEDSSSSTTDSPAMVIAFDGDDVDTTDGLILDDAESNAIDHFDEVQIIWQTDEGDSQILDEYEVN